MSGPQSLSSQVSPWDAAHETEPAAAVSASTAVRSVEDCVSRHFAELNEAVFRYLAYGCRNASDAEEITQETFLRLYRSLRRDERISNVRHWVFKVARNLMLDRAKHLRRIAPKVCDMPEDADDHVRCPRPTPEELMIEAARQRRLRHAIDALTPLQRECMQLRSQGLRLREIGDILKMDVRRVAEALQRAVANLRRTMDA
jgi:RNA polymerase sigma-70 factor (ECF subfamily)